MVASLAAGPLLCLLSLAGAQQAQQAASLTLQEGVPSPLVQTRAGPVQVCLVSLFSPQWFSVAIAGSCGGGAAEVPGYPLRRPASGGAAVPAAPAAPRLGEHAAGGLRGPGLPPGLQQTSCRKPVTDQPISTRR